jgi:NAD(P)-dependent dehydrogenase (short-subunit alcohol dehydrogenase family)
MGLLEQKVAVITGGSSGIGLATAHAFSREGARLALFARDEGHLDEARRSLGGEPLVVPGDVANVADLERLYTAVGSRYGGIDVLFVNAGLAEWRLAEEVTPEHFDRLFSVNVRGAFFTVQKALPLLRPRASVVLNTSVANRVGAARTSVYAAGKAALRSFARTLSAELLPRSVRVNAVSPGPTETPIHEKYSVGMSPEVLREMGRATMGRLALGRLAKAEEIAEAVLFLAAPSSSFVVGQELAVDGGITAL